VPDLTTDQLLWAIAGLLLVFALLAAFAEHRRKNRRDLDKVGLMPWNFIQVIAFLCAVVAAVLALKA
jgi:phosphoglycerol transferase MdoB-like AlkP superfamily enzyme